MQDPMDVAEGLAKHRDNFAAINRMLLVIRMGKLPLDSVRFGRWQALNAKLLLVDNYRPRRSGERNTSNAKAFRHGLGLLAKATSVFRLKKTACANWTPCCGTSVFRAVRALNRSSGLCA